MSALEAEVPLWFSRADYVERCCRESHGFLLGHERECLFMTKPSGKPTSKCKTGPWDLTAVLVSSLITGLPRQRSHIPFLSFLHLHIENMRQNFHPAQTFQNLCCDFSVSFDSHMAHGPKNSMHVGRNPGVSWQCHELQMSSFMEQLLLDF